jgi:hypothetical protein
VLGLARGGGGAGVAVARAPSEPRRGFGVCVATGRGGGVSFAGATPCNVRRCSATRAVAVLNGTRDGTVGPVTPGRVGARGGAT